MIESLADRMAHYIKTAAPDHPASVAILKHALAVVLNVVFILALTLGIAGLTGKIVEAAILLGTFALLRQLTGGIHLKTGMGCVLATSIGVTALSFVQLNYNWTMTATVLSIAFIGVYAPSGIEKQSRIPKRYYPLLKWTALVLVATNLWIGSPIVAISFLAQSLTLIRRLQYIAFYYR